MTTQELKEYIGRVLGNSIRCLLPAFWWKRIFFLVIDWAEEMREGLMSEISYLKNITREHVIYIPIENATLSKWMQDINASSYGQVANINKIMLVDAEGRQYDQIRPVYASHSKVRYFEGDLLKESSFDSTGIVTTIIIGGLNVQS